MEQERPERVGNVHFTDVAVDGEMAGLDEVRKIRGYD
jgi:hypothetical protein